MFAAGEPDMPPLPIAGGIADQMGAIMLAYGVLAALLARERFGVGQEVDASHLGSMSSAGPLALVAADDGRRDPAHAAQARAQPALEPLPLQGRPVDRARHAAARPLLGRLRRALGRPELATDERFATMRARAGNCAALIEILDEVFASQPRAEWLDILRAGGDFIFSS